MIHTYVEFIFFLLLSAFLENNVTNEKGFTLTLQETRSIHDSMNLPKFEFIAYIHILL